MGDLNEECKWFPELPECGGGSGGGNQGGGAFPFPDGRLALIPEIIVEEKPWIFPLLGDIAFLSIATLWTVVPMIR